MAVRIARECNEDAAKIIADHPHRFGAFALLPLPDVEASIRETAYALDTLKLEGICLLSHTGTRHLGHHDDDELYAELDRRKAVVFVHPLRNEAKNLPVYDYPAGITELVTIEPPETGPGGRDVSPITTSIFSSGTPVFCEVSCARFVYVPVPMSCVPQATRAVPSSRSWTLASAGKRAAIHAAPAVPQPSVRPSRFIEPTSGVRFDHPNFSAPSW